MIDRVEDDPIPAEEVYLGLAEVFQGLPPVAEDTEGRIPDGYPFAIPDPDPPLDISKANISEHLNEEQRQKIVNVIKENSSLFRPGLGQFNDGVEMPIPFKDDVDIKDLKQPPYNMSPRDRKAFDKIVDPLKNIGVVENVPLGKPSPASSPAFLVWRDGKERVVVDMRRVNTKMNCDAYPLPKQDDILTAMGGATVFSVLDMTKSFFQQRIRPEDRWKTAFVTPHRGQEQFTVATMGLGISPPFFQHRMEKLFGQYLWQFVLVYIDDTIIFSKDIESHIKHLSIVLNLLRKSGVTLQLGKCHFAQQGLRALGHWVSRLGLSTVEDKVEAIRALKFPENLVELENGYGFFGYYRKFVSHFAGIARPLQELKTLGFKGSPIDKKPRAAFARKRSLTEVVGDNRKLLEDCKQAWQTLKDRLCEAPQLAFPDFDKPFILYVDGSKERGFGAALHQVGEDGIEHPVLFLSRDLTPAEQKYWPTELETGALVWALQKLPQYLDHGKLTVHTDHSSITSAFKDLGPVHGKRSNRLANWRLFLQKYIDRMEIKHRPGKLHTNADALSRLPREPYDNVTLPPDNVTLLPDNVTLSPDNVISPPADVTLLPSEHRTLIPSKGCVQFQYVQAFPVQTRSSTTKDVRFDEVVSVIPPTDNITPTTPSPLPPSPKETNSNHKPSQEAPEEEQHYTSTTFSLHIKPRLLKEIAKETPSDPAFRKVYGALVKMHDKTSADADGPVTTLHCFRRDPDTKLLYFTDKGQHRLCIPKQCFPQLLTMFHNNRAHIGPDRVYSLLHPHVYFPKMRHEILKWTSHCPTCKKAKPKHNLPWGLLQPIEHPGKPFSVLCFDFVEGLPLSRQGNDKVLFITCKSTKYVKYLVGKETFTAEDWAALYFERIYLDWGLPDSIISDRDSRFVSSFWTRLFSLAKTELALTTSYHSQADGQSERTNQTFIHALRCALEGKYDQSGWEDLLPYIQLCMNSAINTSTKSTPFMLMYGRDAKTEFSPDESETPDFVQQRIDLRQEAADLVKLAQAKMKLYYDAKHAPPKFEDAVYLKLTKKGEKGYHLQNQTKLSFFKVGPLDIIRPHGNLAYEIELPDWLKGIHPVISVEHLEPANKDPYNRPQPEPGPIFVNGEHRYIIEKIIGKELRKVEGQPRRQIFYHVKWLDHLETTWESRRSLLQQVPKIVHDYEADRSRRPAQSS